MKYTRQDLIDKKIAIKCDSQEEANRIVEIYGGRNDYYVGRNDYYSGLTYYSFSTKNSCFEFFEKSYKNETEIYAYDIIKEYETKSKEDYEPFTFDDCEMFLGKYIKSKKMAGMISFCDNQGIYLHSGTYVAYNSSFEQFTFLDGTPFGKLKKQS